MLQTMLKHCFVAAILYTRSAKLFVWYLIDLIFATFFFCFYSLWTRQVYTELEYGKTPFVYIKSIHCRHFSMGRPLLEKGKCRQFQGGLMLVCIQRTTVWRSGNSDFNLWMNSIDTSNRWVNFERQMFFDTCINACTHIRTRQTCNSFSFFLFMRIVFYCLLCLITLFYLWYLKGGATPVTPPPLDPPMSDRGGYKK